MPGNGRRRRLGYRPAKYTKDDSEGSDDGLTGQQRLTQIKNRRAYVRRCARDDAAQGVMTMRPARRSRRPNPVVPVTASTRTVTQLYPQATTTSSAAIVPWPADAAASAAAALPWSLPDPPAPPPTLSVSRRRLDWSPSASIAARTRELVRMNSTLKVEEWMLPPPVPVTVAPIVYRTSLVGAAVSDVATAWRISRVAAAQVLAASAAQEAPLRKPVINIATVASQQQRRPAAIAVPDSNYSFVGHNYNEWACEHCSMACDISGHLEHILFLVGDRTQPPPSIPGPRCGLRWPGLYDPDFSCTGRYAVCFTCCSRFLGRMPEETETFGWQQRQASEFID